MYVNLHKAGMVVLSEHYYWSASEDDAYYAWYQDFRNGSQLSTLRTSHLGLRAARAF